MKTSRWSYPYSGLAYFLTHPTLWGWAFLGTVVSVAMSVFLFVKVVQWTYPRTTDFWPVVQSFGWGFLSLILMIAIVFPLLFNVCFARGFCNLLKRENATHVEESMTTAFISSFWVFFRTLRWRILWPLLLIATIIFIPPLIFPLSLLAANHLATIEGVDLALSLFGKKAGERVHWLNQYGTDCFTIAVSGALLSFLLGLTGVGWIFWIPSVYCGAFLWVRSEIEKNKERS